MVSVAFILLLLSVFCFYFVAGKTAFEAKGIIVKVTKRPLVCRGLGALFGMTGTAMLIIAMGKAVGVLTALFVWTVIASLALLFAPFRKVKVIHVFLLCTSLWLIDMIF